jgi:hypothetical protein
LYKSLQTEQKICSEKIGAIQNQSIGPYARANFEIGYRSDELLAKRERQKFQMHPEAFERGATIAGRLTFAASASLRLCENLRLKDKANFPPRRKGAKWRHLIFKDHNRSKTH